LRISEEISAARAAGGVVNGAKRFVLAASAAATLARLYLLPAKNNALPAQVRLQAAW
jgi:magnesium-protoporphyrin IX monomethyl ester (oxidative) cyclase